MNWYVNTKEGAVGPIPEEQVVTMLRSGLPVLGVCQEGADQWVPAASISQFAASAPLSTVSSAQPAGLQRPPIVRGWIARLAWAFAILGGLVIVIAIGVSRPQTSAPAPTPTGPAYHVGEEPKSEPKSDAERILEVPELSRALAIALPQMTDKLNEHSAGTFLLTGWAMRNMSWSQVGVPNDETSWALARKDIDEERGKRLCATGSLVQIEAGRVLDVGKMSSGLLMSYAGKLFSFLAVGKTGTLVADSSARICGVVTGLYDYSNSGGGTGHAVEIVGMFDLPQNKPQMPVAKSPQPKRAAVDPVGELSPCAKRCEDTMLPEKVNECIVATCGDSP